MRKTRNEKLIWSVAKRKRTKWLKQKDSWEHILNFIMACVHTDTYTGRQTDRHTPSIYMYNARYRVHPQLASPHSHCILNTYPVRGMHESAHTNLKMHGYQRWRVSLAAEACRVGWNQKLKLILDVIKYEPKNKIPILCGIVKTKSGKKYVRT